ncbi:uncharacterized protein LOC121711290 isoform X2 [Alosa sapidissima]|uniref:uncharacterized protein LOC121711289 isoform X2 n=1 Tax=Alosa sapidissima TaxID=34773 RepID=UPI001C08F552|nr:uncharacterized protein LOC121711289 isoform X2 [Alosa sapidissima]XP_041950688.1 uncharacterized protein LOC121711290 isoform X2 [Alosa sapidissima]
MEFSNFLLEQDPAAQFDQRAITVEETMYHIVSFDDFDEVEVVPATWVNGGVCRWPPYKGEGLQRAIKNFQEPDNTWALYNVRVLYTDNYHEARKRLPLAEQQTDLQSEAEIDAGRPQKRTIKRNRHFDVYESDDEEVAPKRSMLPKPPQIPSPSRFRRYIISPQSDQHVTTLGSTLRQAIDAVNLTEVPNGEVDTGPALNQGQIREVQAAPEAPRQRLKNSSVCGQLCGSLLHDMLVKQEIIIEQQKNIVRMVQDLHDAFASATDGSNVTQGTVYRHSAYFPLKGPDDLMVLERDLQSVLELKKDLTLLLGLAGGATLRETVWRVLQRVFTNEFSQKVTWRGLSGKVAFEKQLLKTIVIDAVRRNPVCSVATEAEIETTIKKWFYWAGDRNGGRKRRLHSPSNPATQTQGTQIHIHQLLSCPATQPPAAQLPSCTATQPSSTQLPSHPAPGYLATQPPAAQHPATQHPAAQLPSHPAPSYPATSYPAPSYPATSYPVVQLHSHPAPSYPATQHRAT